MMGTFPIGYCYDASCLRPYGVQFCMWASRWFCIFQTARGSYASHVFPLITLLVVTVPSGATNLVWPLKSVFRQRGNSFLHHILPFSPRISLFLQQWNLQVGIPAWKYLALLLYAYNIAMAVIDVFQLTYFVMVSHLPFLPALLVALPHVCWSSPL